jgi:hypothetical protein
MARLNLSFPPRIFTGKKGLTVIPHAHDQTYI